MEGTGSMTLTTPEAALDREQAQLRTQLADVRARLLKDLVRPGRTEADVLAEFDRTVDRFETARVRSFVSILVERAVRARFGTDAIVAAEPAA